MTKEFDVVRDAPVTPEQALAVLESWAGNLSITFSRERCGLVLDALKNSSDELKFLALVLDALAPIEKLFAHADEQNILTKANIDCQIDTNNLRKLAYVASDIRAHLDTEQPKEPLDLPLPCNRSLPRH
jgi:hypothetical protein